MIFTSDNGSRARNQGGSNEPLRGTKFTTWEGGMRVPCIMRWPDAIPAGRVCGKLAASIDLYPTLAAICGALPNGKMLANAAAGLVVCGDIDKTHGSELSYMLQDCSAAIENILLAANALGIGTCWLGVHPREDRVGHIRAIFQLPENIIPVSVVSMGYPVENPMPRSRYDNGLVHNEKW